MLNFSSIHFQFHENTEFYNISPCNLSFQYNKLNVFRLENILQSLKAIIIFYYKFNDLPFQCNKLHVFRLENIL